MKLVLKELPSTLLYGLLQPPAKKGVFSPSWYWMRTLMGKVPSCRPHSDGRVGPAASCWALPTIPCCCGKKQRGLGQEPSSQDLRWKEGRKHSEKRGSAIEFCNAGGCSNMPFVQANKPRQREKASSIQLCLWPEQSQVPRIARPKSPWAMPALCSHHYIHAQSQSGEKAGTRPVHGDLSPWCPPSMTSVLLPRPGKCPSQSHQ